MISLIRKGPAQPCLSVISIRTCAHRKIAARAPLRVARAHTQGRHITDRGLRVFGGLGERGGGEGGERPGGGGKRDGGGKGREGGSCMDGRLDR